MGYKRNTVKAAPRRSNRISAQNKNIADNTESVHTRNEFAPTDSQEITASPSQTPNLHDIKKLFHEDPLPIANSPAMFEMNALGMGSDRTAVNSEELFETPEESYLIFEITSPLSSEESDSSMLTDTEEEGIPNQGDHTTLVEPLQFNQNDMEIDISQPNYDKSEPYTTAKKGKYTPTRKPAAPRANEAILKASHANIMVEDAPETINSNQDLVTANDQSEPIALGIVYSRETSPAVATTVEELIQDTISIPIELVASITKKSVQLRKVVSISRKDKGKAREASVEPPIEDSIVVMEKASQMFLSSIVRHTAEASGKKIPAATKVRNAAAAINIVNAKPTLRRESVITDDATKGRHMIDLTATESVDISPTDINPVFTTEIEQADVFQSVELADKIQIDKVHVDEVQAKKLHVDEMQVEKVQDEKVQADRILMDDVAVNQVSVDQVSIEKVHMVDLPVDQVSVEKVPMDNAALNQVPVEKILLDDAALGQVSVNKKNMDVLPMDIEPAPNEVVANAPVTIESVPAEPIYSKSLNPEPPPTNFNRHDNAKNVGPAQYNTTGRIESAATDPIAVEPFEFVHVVTGTGSKRSREKKPVKDDPYQDTMDISAGNTDVRSINTKPTSKTSVSTTSPARKSRVEANPVHNDTNADSTDMESHDNVPVNFAKGIVKRDSVKPAIVEYELIEEAESVEKPSRKRATKSASRRPEAPTVKKTLARKTTKKTQENAPDINVAITETLKTPGKEKRGSADKEEELDIEPGSKRTRKVSGKADVKKAPTKKATTKPAIPITEVLQDDFTNDTPDKPFTELTVMETQKTTRRPKRSAATKASYKTPPSPQEGNDYITEDRPIHKLARKTNTKGKEKEVVLTSDLADAEEDDVSILHMLLHSKTSSLATADLKTLIPELLQSLSAEDQQELCELLSDPDVINEKGKSRIRTGFESSSNNYFWEAVSCWQDILYVGGFEKESGASSSKKKDENSSFKDENFEAYWGERMKRNDEILARATSGARGRGKGKGRA